MANVATSIQTALAAKVTGVTCAWSTDHFVITTSMNTDGNSISVLSADDTINTTAVDLAGSSWLNGKYGTGVVTKATATADA